MLLCTTRTPECLMPRQCSLHLLCVCGVVLSGEGRKGWKQEHHNRSCFCLLLYPPLASRVFQTVSISLHSFPFGRHVHLIFVNMREQGKQPDTGTSSTPKGTDGDDPRSIPALLARIESLLSKIKSEVKERPIHVAAVLAVSPHSHSLLVC